MGCAIIRDKKNGSPIFMCGEDIIPCSVCGDVATAFCDFPVGPNQTCNAPLCERHRIKQGCEWQDIDFCPTHVLIAEGKINTKTCLDPLES